jgi:hypothetical protein
MYLIIDEDCPACLVRYAAQHGHTAQRSIHVQGLGRGAPDAAIWAFAQHGGGVIVIRNIVDYVPLAVGKSHAGVLGLPTTHALGMARLFSTFVAWAAGPPFYGNVADHFRQIRPRGGISSFQV